MHPEFCVMMPVFLWAGLAKADGGNRKTWNCTEARRKGLGYYNGRG